MSNLEKVLPKEIPTHVVLRAVSRVKIKHILILQATHDFSISYCILSRYVHHIGEADGKWQRWSYNHTYRVYEKLTSVSARAEIEFVYCNSRTFILA